MILRHSTRRRLLAGIAGLLLASGLSWGGAAYAQSDAPLVIARDMDLNSLDPHRSFCDTCQIYNSAAYEALVTLDKDNHVAPLIASKWEANAEQTKFTFTLDPAAKFSDGSPVEAKDVKWTFERLKNIQGSPAFFTASISGIETPDAHTVVVSTAAPNSEFFNLAASAYMGIINSDVAAEAGAKADASASTADNAEPWFLAHSAGSGPFVLESYEPNSELRLKRNENYWRQKPAVSEVVMRQVKDAVAQAQLLESGGADIAMQIDPETAKTITSPDVTVKTTPSFNFIYVALSPGAKNNKVKLTPEVREAVSLAIDRPALLDFTLSGEGQLISAPIPLGFPGGSNFPPQPYDPAKAKELLAKSGNADGFEIEATFPAMNVYGVDLSLMMQKVQQDLAAVGIKAELQPIPFSNWRERVNGDGIPLTAVFYAPDFFGTSQYIDYFGMTEGSPWARRAGAKNDPSVLNPKTAETYKAALAAKPEDAEKLWHEAGEQMIADRVILPLVSPNLILAYRNSVKGVRYSACCNLPLAEISH